MARTSFNLKIVNELAKREFGRELRNESWLTRYTRAAVKQSNAKLITDREREGESTKREEELS